MSANNVFFKPSFSLENLLSEELRGDSERFLLFLQAYYEWLQTATIEITSLSGTFVRDEVITGGTSNAKAIIKEVKTGAIVIRMRTERPLDIGETITGGTSGATATVSVIADNVIRKTGQLLNYRDATKTVDKYVDFLKAELYSTLPQNIEANKRFVARKYRDFLQNKGNEESYKFLFRTIYDENIELKYPGEDILRVSDGNFEKTQIIRAVIEDEETIFDYLNQTITGQDSGALANVVDIKLINVGSIRVAEMTLKLVSGTFDGGERIEIVGTETTNTAIYGMVTGFTINDGGSGYSVGDVVTITSGEGSEASATVSSIQASAITAVKVNTPGYGYRLNTNAIITNTGTGGTGLAVRVTEIANTYTVNGYTVGETATVSIVGRGSGYYRAPVITLTDSVIESLGLLSENLISIANSGIDYAVGDTLVFTGGAGTNAAGQVASVQESTTYDLLFEDDFRMIADGSYADIVKNEDWSVTGGITRLELTNFGDGYTSANLPSISVTTGTGSGANLIATGIQGVGANVAVDIANNSAGIGSIRKIDISNFGVNYTTANVNLTGVGDGNANVTAVISGLGVKEGNWIDDDGKIDYKILQDSDYYQDFSYVIRSGLEFNLYSNIVKQVIHPAGLQFFGEILITTELDVSPIFTSTLETVTNVNKYITYLILQGNASVEVTYAGLQSTKIFESILQAQTAIYTALERLISIQTNINVSPIFSSTIEIVNNIKEYVIYLQSVLSAYEANNFTERQIKINSESNLAAIYNSIETLLKIETVTDVAPIISSTINIISNVNQYIVYLQSVVNTETLNSFTERQIKVESPVTIYSFDTLGPNVITIGDSLISEFANVTISTFESLTFEDIYGTGLKTLKKNIKVAGTVTVSSDIVVGSGTTLNNDFANGDNIIIGNEKFIVESVANTDYLVLNVSAQGSYSGASAYKEAA